MRTIYIDSNYICHAEYAEGRTEIETDVLDAVCNPALPCYKFVPAHDEKTDLIQCFDSYRADAIQSAYNDAKAEAQAEITDMQTALGILGVE